MWYFDEYSFSSSRPRFSLIPTVWAVELFYLYHSLSCIVLFSKHSVKRCMVIRFEIILYSLSFFSQHSLGDILSSDFYDDNDFIPALFTVLHATDVNIASGLRTENEGPYIALLEVTYCTDISILMLVLLNYYSRSEFTHTVKTSSQIDLHVFTLFSSHYKLSFPTRVYSMS